ncbi:CerR family C-terminal domain-containing protein [Anaerosinus sp.]
MDKDTRTKLIEIATKLFATKGFFAVSVREVTSIAQVNVSAISYYFQSKEGLYQEVLKNQLKPVLEALDLVEKQIGLSAMERFRFFANQVAKVHLNYPYLTRFMMNEVTSPTEYGGAIVENQSLKVYRFIYQTIKAGVEDGEFKSDLDIPHTAFSLAGMMIFYFVTKPIRNKIMPNEENSVDTYLTNVLKNYLYGIASE